MNRNRKNPIYIETNEDGGAKTIELWCYQEAESEVDSLSDRLKLAENELSACRAELKAAQLEVERVRDAVTSAKNNLEDCREELPFGGLVYVCNVSAFDVLTAALEPLAPGGDKPAPESEA